MLEIVIIFYMQNQFKFFLIIDKKFPQQHTVPNSVCVKLLKTKFNRFSL